MKMYIGGAGIGKTRHLINEAIITDGIIVCESPERIREKCQAYNVKNVDAITYDEFINFETDPNRKYYVKNLESLLERMGIESFTLTAE